MGSFSSFQRMYTKLSAISCHKCFVRSSATTQDDKSVEQELEEAKLAEDRNKEHAITTSTKAVSRRGATKQQQQQHDGKTKDQRRKSPSGKSRSGGRRTSVLSSPPPDVGGTPASELDGR